MLDHCGWPFLHLFSALQSFFSEMRRPEQHAVFWQERGPRSRETSSWHHSHYRHVGLVFLSTSFSQMGFSSLQKVVGGQRQVDWWVWHRKQIRLVCTAYQCCHQHPASVGGWQEPIRVHLRCLLLIPPLKFQTLVLQLGLAAILISHNAPEQCQIRDNVEIVNAAKTSCTSLLKAIG